MNKNGTIDSLDILEVIKIGLGLIIFYILIKALLNSDTNNNEIKCLCDCVNNSIKTIYLN